MAHDTEGFALDMWQRYGDIVRIDCYIPLAQFSRVWVRGRPIILDPPVFTETKKRTMIMTSAVLQDAIKAHGLRLVFGESSLKLLQMVVDRYDAPA